MVVVFKLHSFCQIIIVLFLQGLAIVIQLAIFETFIQLKVFYIH